MPQSSDNAERDQLIADRDRLNWIEQMANDCEGHLLTRLFMPDGKPFREKIDKLRAINRAAGDAR